MQGLDTRRPVQKPSQAVQNGRFLTRPTPAVTPPARPEVAKTTSSPKDAPGPRARPQKATQDSSSRLAWLLYSGMARMSPPLRASNEGLLRSRVARAQGIQRAIPPAGGLYQQPASRVQEG